jgi:hypothetical protein
MMLPQTWFLSDTVCFSQGPSENAIFEGIDSARRIAYRKAYDQIKNL